MIRQLTQKLKKIDDKIYISASKHENVIMQTSYIRDNANKESCLKLIRQEVGKYFNIDTKDNFINLSFKNISTIEYIFNSLEQEKRTRNELCILDYFQVNVGKHIHLGHLRGAIIGRTLQIALEFNGYRTISDIHMGDFGYIYGIYADYIVNNKIDLESLSVNDLHKAYIAQCDTKIDDYHKAVYKLYCKDKKMENIRQRLFEITKEYIASYISSFDLRIDRFYTEYRYIELCDYITKRALLNSDFDISNKCLTYKADSSSIILTRSNGTPLYIYTDIATMFERIMIDKADKIFYLIDVRQEEHINDAAKIYKALFGSTDTEIIFKGFGMVKKENETLSSRKKIFVIQDFFNTIYQSISLDDRKRVESALIYNEGKHIDNEDYKIDNLSIIHSIEKIREYEKYIQNIDQMIESEKATILAARFFIDCQDFTREYNLKLIHNSIRDYMNYVIKNKEKSLRYNTELMNFIRKLYKIS